MTIDKMFIKITKLKKSILSWKQQLRIKEYVNRFLDCGALGKLRA